MNRSLIDLRHRMARSIALLGLMLVSLLLCGQASAAPTLSPASGTALPDVAVNTPMQPVTITATGGAMPIFEWYECDQDDPSMPTNCLPPGLFLDTSPGSATTTLHGTPTAIGSYDFWISALDNNDDVGKARYTLRVTGATPTLTAVSPGSGGAIGGTSVTLTGTNFVGVTNVTFAGVPATNIIVVAPTLITATVPAHTAGPVNVTVTTASGTSTLTNGFTYLAVPTLTIATPNSGATTGGNQVFISGTGLTGTTSLTFGGTPASSFTVNSSTSITAIAPAHAAGPVNVVATTPGGSATSVNAYTYLAVPTLNTVTPNSGPIGGGTSVTLTGTGLTGASSVTFDGVSATGWTINSPTQITATIPAGNAGVVNVSVTTAAGSASLTNAFTYIAPPVAGPVSASVGHNSSANPVTLSLSGGVASSVAISTSASHGTVTASGTSVTYTPTVGFAGTDSFTYTATNSAGTSAPATVTVTVGSPTISIAPASLPGGTAGIAYSTTSLAASGGNAPYAFSLASGALPSGLTLASNGTLSGTPTSSGNFSFTARATDAFSYTGTRSYTLTIVAGSMAITPATLPAPIYSSSYNQQLTVSGGVAPYTFSINGGSLPTGIALSSTGTLTGSPSSPGTYTFSVTAVDSSSNLTSVSQSYTLTIATPFIDITPITLPAATVGTGYSTSISASGGVAPFDYGIAFGALPAGMSLTSTGTLSGTPTTAGTFTFGVRASDTNRFTGVRPYSFVVGQQAPVAANINQTLAANSGASTISASLSGGPTTSLAVVTPPAHGTVNITGATGFTYTPTPGYAGVDSFTYTATGPGGTSAPATVNLAITPPTVVIGTTTLANATQNVPYTASISASGGTAPYSYTIVSGALPSGMALAPTGSLTGTPTAPGTTSFTVRVTDSQNFQASQALSLTVVAQAPVVGNVSASVAANSRNNPLTLNLGSAPVTSVAVASNPQHGTAQVSGTSITYTPTAGYSGVDSFTYTATGPGGTSAAATVSLTITPPTLVMSPASGTLPPGTVGSAYSFGLGASGGMAPYSYAIGAGSLPNGLQLDPATGVISGTPTEAANATLTVTATDANGATGSRSITLAIAAQVVTVVSSSEALSPGAVASVDLTRGATGGPFLRARVLSLSPASAGHASLTSMAPARAARAALSGFNLRFVPAAAFAGTAVVTFSLESTSGASATGTVTFSVQARPDPSKDAEVIGLLNAQSRAADRFASTQMDNFNRRLEQLHRPTCDRNAFNANVQHGRDNLGLGSLGKALRDELEGNGKGNDDEDADDTRRKQRDTARATSGECVEEAVAYWTDGFINTGSSRARGAKDNSFVTYGLSAGVDYRLSPRAVVGIGFGYGNDRADIGEQDTRSEADALGLAAYLSVNPLSEIYIDALLGYNRIRFDSRRYVTADPSNGYAHGSRDADQLFASLTASYEYREGTLSLAPYTRLNASFTKLDDFSERGGGIYGLSYEQQRQRTFTSFLGVRSGYDIQTGAGVLTPRVGLAWGHNFSRSDDYRMRYTDQTNDGVLYRLSPDPMDSNFVDLDLGLDFSLSQSWRLGFSYKTALATDERNEMFRIGLDGRF
ncbi:putative Ig domain-containing protein [Pseudomonas qingdaonensis]|uniref:putative Ig domain-containing protein n=1 Tax=Pseudomonas qingdaonensis TaxID=2056231 RepID=UPI00333F2695